MSCDIPAAIPERHNSTAYERVTIHVKTSIIQQLCRIIGVQVSSFFSWFIMVIRESVTIPIIWGIRASVGLAFIMAFAWVIQWVFPIVYGVNK